jgi:hypothetical protein
MGMSTFEQFAGFTFVEEESPDNSEDEDEDGNGDGGEGGVKEQKDPGSHNTSKFLLFECWYSQPPESPIATEIDS